MPMRAKLFVSGRSQAVRFPKGFRLPGEEVLVTRIGEALLLEPVGGAKPFDGEAFWARLDAISGRNFPLPYDDDLRPERDGGPSFEGSR